MLNFVNRFAVPTEVPYGMHVDRDGDLMVILAGVEVGFFCRSTGAFCRKYLGGESSETLTNLGFVLSDDDDDDGSYIQVD